MCGRYFMGDDDKAEELQQIIDILNRKPSSNTAALKTSGEVFPSDTVPDITNSRTLKPTPFAMEWGYTTSDGNRLINARSETASEKPTFKDGMAQRRCIIPASRDHLRCRTRFGCCCSRPDTSCSWQRS